MTVDDEPVFDVVDPSSADAVGAMRRYVEELDRRFPSGFDVEGALRSSSASLAPPLGVFLLGRLDGRVVACGGAQWLDERRGEIKRMWVDPDTRGRGLGRRMLERLEAEVSSSGRSTVLLDTNGTLTEAIALYRRCGYRDVERYNDNPDAELWFEKTLDP